MNTNEGLKARDFGGFELTMSVPERAILELLYYVPHKEGFEESALIAEFLVSLRPKLMQSLLEQCSLIKVNRLLLLLAEHLNHPWFKDLEVSKINLGNGIRELAKNGFFNHKYKIIVPKEYANG